MRWSNTFIPTLRDDPADHRGLLSWAAQKRDGTLSEAGSHGELVSASVPLSALRAAQRQGEVVIRLEVDEAVYRSERETGHRNRAIANLLRGTGAIDGDPEAVCDAVIA